MTRILLNSSYLPGGRGEVRSQKRGLMGLSLNNTLKEKDKKIEELTRLVETISRGKYMWESTFDAITDPVIIVSSDFVIQRANLASAKTAKMDVRQLIGTRCYESLAGFSSPCRGCPLGITLSSHTSQSSDLPLFQKNLRQYHANAHPLTGEAYTGQAVIHYQDVSQERELQHKLIHSEKMAAIGMLAGGVAHEINNPLGGVLAFTQLVIKDLGPLHPDYSDLKEIEEATLRCKRIVQDLLDFSRQNKEEAMEAIGLNEVLAKLIPLIQVQTKTNRIEMNYDLAENLPPIHGNVPKLQQVFLNLVTNAYHAMQGGGKLTLKTSYDRQTKRVMAWVTDTGTGIDPEHVDKIFDPYFTTKDQDQGTGLGLAITYGIIQEHQGTIEVNSEVGKGSTFSLSFPALEEKK